MRAIVMESAGAPLTAVEREVPEPRWGEAVLRMKASCLNYHDFVNIQGHIPGPFPRVPLSDGCGEVVAVGEGVERVAVGDRVAPGFFPRWTAGPASREVRAEILGDHVDGCLQQYLRVSAQALVRVPGHLSDLEAATLPCAGVTAWTAVGVHRPVGPGDTVVVQGTGGVSMFALQLAKAAGARVIATSSSDEKLERVAKLGADEGICYRTTPEWERRVLELTDGRGADLIIDNGGPSTLAQSIKAAAYEGHVSIIGVLGGFGNAEIPLGLTMAKNVTLQGLMVGSRQDFEDMCRVIAAHRIQPVVGEVVGFEDVPRGVELMSRGAHFGKIAIEID